MTTEPLAASPDVEPTGVAPQPVELASPPAPARVEPFVLPLGTLEAIAESAGLQWVNSDAEKIRAAREAMAREPAPIHVPRERKPVQRIDEGPLVLVETRKDLSQVKLPFETAQQETQGGS
jgi:ribonuclease E